MRSWITLFSSHSFSAFTSSSFMFLWRFSAFSRFSFSFLCCSLATTSWAFLSSEPARAFVRASLAFFSPAIACNFPLISFSIACNFPLISFSNRALASLSSALHSISFASTAFLISAFHSISLASISFACRLEVSSSFFFISSSIFFLYSEACFSRSAVPLGTPCLRSLMINSTVPLCVCTTL